MVDLVGPVTVLGGDFISVRMKKDMKIDLEHSLAISELTLHCSNHATNCRRNLALRYFTTVGPHDTILIYIELSQCRLQACKSSS